jgi:type I restriction enzyme R subunit
MPIEIDGIEEIFKLDEGQTKKSIFFSNDYMAKIDKIKLLTQKIKLLQKLLAKSN